MDFLSQNEGEPTRFIRDLRDKSSIVVFYEEQKYARSLGFLFLDIGLRGSMTCLYLSSEAAPSAEAAMTSAGISTADLKADKLQIRSIANHKKDQITKTIEDFVRGADDCTSRIVIQHDRFTKEQQQDLLSIEEFIQEIFKKHDVSVMNIYNTEFMDNAGFMQQIINMHDYTIFAPDFGKGIVVKMR